MPKSPTTYHRPETLHEALQLLDQPDTFALAGGTKLNGKDANGAVVDLQELDLNKIEWIGETLHVGALTTLTGLAGALPEADETASLRQLVALAIKQAGPNTYRNAATIGGTVAARLADSELLAVLLVLDAQLVLHNPAETTMPLAAYLDAAARPSGLITTVQIPWRAGRGTSARVARTPADTPIVSITLWRPAGGQPALAATGLGERPALLETAASLLEAGLTGANIAAAADAAAAACTHPGDFRGDAAYRASMASVLTRRVCGSLT